MTADLQKIQELLTSLRSEAEGDRGEYYELYGSAIQPVLLPLAELLEANLQSNPELVEIVLLSLDQYIPRVEARIAELRAEIAAKSVDSADSKKLWSFFWDCGRQGTVQGTFVATQGEIDGAIGSSIYFGEILGKHSEVYGELEAKDLTVISADPQIAEVFERHVGSAGYNPLDYLGESEEDE